MYKVALSHSEESLVRLIAHQRTENDKQNGVRDKRVSSISHLEMQINGLGGEFAVAKKFNLCPDFSMSLLESERWDLINRTGYRLDVKTTEFPINDDLMLLVATSKNVTDCDVYILVSGKIPVYTIVGWIWSNEVFKPENIADLGHGPTYAIPYKKLERFKEKNHE